MPHWRCPSRRGGSGSWPVGTGHPCFGCTEEGVGFTKAIHQLADVKNIEPPASYPGIHEPQGSGVTPGSAALLSGVAGAALGAGAVLIRDLGRKTGDAQAPRTDQGNRP